MNQILRRLVAVAASAVVLAGCSSSTTPQAHRDTDDTVTPTQSTTEMEPMARHNVEAPIDQIPWSQVGPGWTLAMWNEATPMGAGGEAVPGQPTPYNAATTLFLVDPAGGRYPITTFDAPGDDSAPTLADWSGDGNRALFYDRDDDNLIVIEVDLHTGEQTSFTVSGYSTTPRYTRPEGKAVILDKSQDVDSPAALSRVDLTGKPQLTYPVGEIAGEYKGVYLSQPDGTALVLGTGSGLAMMGNDGRPGRALPIPESDKCEPVRWWEPGTVVAHCYGADFGFTRLWLVPTDGSAPTPLTPKNDGSEGPDLADLNAWKLSAGTFVQAAGGCGYVYLAKLNDDGSTTKVDVPEVDEHRSVIVKAVVNDQLLLQASLSCGSGESLVSYDPSTNSTTVLLGGTVNGGGVISVLAYRGDE